jgi:hypothetical protein
MIITFLKSISPSTWVAFGALIISILSLLLSTRKSKFDRQIMAAQKRSDLLIKLLSTRRNFDDAISSLNNINPIEEDCQRSITELIGSTNSILDGINTLYKKLEDMGDDVDPLKLERMLPDITEQLMLAERMLKAFQDRKCTAREKKNKTQNNKKISNPYKASGCQEQ